jgi:hypothetical protein
MTLFPSIQNVQNLMIIGVNNVIINDDFVPINLNWLVVTKFINICWQGLERISIFKFSLSVNPGQGL